ncbi:Molybdopterin synthase sulfur carrier subunit [Vibrio stylophorae]|uniref:Molybdopterin synthase sulfur carrier subunit n=1 Tax=Vibrio stylophorae TaxID=659351 RepID=A0ABN8DQ75_9VIBR|nr:molybdopterin converting factor subunit 1 [Vibrio stylophorae]CAH0533319.1 Molybdopterin synthase sulfur carrier subunit [Vibrio stylophorae]
MITVRFFAALKERVGVETLTWPAVPETTAALRDALAAQSDEWHQALTQGPLLVAVNHTMTHWSQALEAGDEVAFFPPVTGG